MSTCKTKEKMVKFTSTILKENFCSFKNTLKLKRNHRLDNACNTSGQMLLFQNIKNFYELI